MMKSRDHYQLLPPARRQLSLGQAPMAMAVFLQFFDEFLEAIHPQPEQTPLLLGNLFVLAPRVGEFLET